ncbi:MAG: hypothetical protein ABL895_20810, partial [Cyclobacteriaceae bacterium]
FMSHIKNMQNFDKVIAVCTGLGGTYNPGKQNLRVESLTALLNNAHSALESLKVAKTNFEYATNYREVAFRNLPKLTGRIISELKSSEVLVQTVDDARYIHRKLTGFRVSRDPVPPEKAEATSQKKFIAKGRDFTTQADHFAKLLQTLRTEPNYQPVPDDLKLPALEARLSDLYAKNGEVMRATVELKNARSHRDEMLYLKQGNVHETYLAVRQTVRAAYGFSSQQYKALAGVRFTK